MNLTSGWFRTVKTVSCSSSINDSLNSLLECINYADNFEDAHYSQEKKLGEFLPKWLEFQLQLGITGKYWQQYINMVIILKRYIASEKGGVWKNHLKEMNNMLTYIVSTGHVNYASCTPIYLK